MPLAALLEAYYQRFDARAHLRSDPVQFPHRYPRAADQEVVALIAATLAFGRVAGFLPVIEGLLAELGPQPATVLALDAGTEPHPAVLAASRRRHRWLGPEDLLAFLRTLGAELRSHGSLEHSFAQGGLGAAPDTWGPLAHWSRHLRGVAAGYHRQAAARGRALAFLFPDGSGAGANKRQHLFLRWVVRPPVEGCDLGLWTRVSPRQLVMPCDTHTARIGHALSFCPKPEPSRATATALTETLRGIDPSDPVRFDFALCHLGISAGCKGRRIDDICGSCTLRSACRWWGSTGAA